MTKPVSSRKTAYARALMTRLGYEFKDPTLFDQALTHSSALSGGEKAKSYQRLEFLGDRVLGLAIATMLLTAFPREAEGDLSRRLAALVRAETCTLVAKAMQAEKAVRLGKTKGTQARLTDTILADVAEAIIGAVYLDGGYPAAAAVVERYWSALLLQPAMPLLDPKTILQEWAQGRGMPMPVYREIGRTGPHHDPRFKIEVALKDREPAEGAGRSKRAAEQAAAAAMLLREKVIPEPRDD